MVGSVRQVTVLLAVVLSCIYTYPAILPSRHVFGALNFSLFEEEQHELPFNTLETSSLGYEPKGISLSFYVDTVSTAERAQRVFSVHGVEVLFNRTAEEQCDIVVVTQYKLNITYELSHCSRRTHVILDLYDKAERTISSLYENLVLVYGRETRGWCEYDGMYLKESTEPKYKISDYSYDATSRTLDEVKEICLKTTTSIEGAVCRGITLMKSNNYTLRVGDIPITSMEDETTYMNGPCLDEESTEEESSAVLLLHKTPHHVLLSHINVDALRVVGGGEEATRRWKRYELGNMQPGLWLNFGNFEREHVPYDTSVQTPNYLRYFWASLEQTSISEGMFIQEHFVEPKDRGGKYFQLDDNNVNFAWAIENVLFTELRYCEFNIGEIDEAVKESCLDSTSCCGVASNGSQVESCDSNNEILMRKGFCKLDGAGTEKFKLSRRSLMDSHQIRRTFGQYVVGFIFRSLPKIDNIFEKQKTHECKFTRTTNSGDIPAILSLVTSRDGYRLRIKNISEDNSLEHYYRVNASDDQSIMHRMTLSSSVEYVEYVSLVGDECPELRIDTFTTDICDANMKIDDYGYYFLRRAKFDETVEVPCNAADTETEGISSSSTTWRCADGSWVQAGEPCPFYQCYNGEGLYHDPSFTNVTRIAKIRKGITQDGDCCGGQWHFTCEENYKINYDNCSQLQPCQGSQTIGFGVTEGNGNTSTAFVTTTKTIFANNAATVDCDHSSGKVTLRCDGCSGRRTFLSHTCTVQFCLQKGKEQFFDLSWNNARTIKYGISFNYTLKDPFSYNDTISVACPYGGSVEITCSDAQFTNDLTLCEPAPKCPEKEFQLHPLKGKVKFASVFAGESSSTACSVNPEGTATTFCNASGKWESPDQSNCSMGPCGTIDFVDRGVAFSTSETNPDEYSTTSCKLACGGENCEELEMCSEGTCGQRLCNSTSGRYNEPDYSSCEFNCTYKKELIQHGSYGDFNCARNNGDRGVQYVECDNDVAKPKPCVLITCPYLGGTGCVDTDPEKLKKAETSELVNDLDSFLDNVDLSSPQAKKDTENIVNAVMSKSLDSSAPMSQDNKAKIAGVIDKVAMNLATSGGKIVSEGVTMFGISSTARRKRSSLENSYLSDNGIEGRGYNGSIGLSVFAKTDLFKPQNESKERLGSTAVKSLTTEFKSQEIDINITFPLTKKYSTSALSCTYYEPETGEWLSDGCNPHFSDDNKTTICHCTHLTSFAVLVSLDKIDDAKQSLATKIMITISIASLSATIIAIAPFRKLRHREIIRLHLNLVSSTLIANLAFLSLEAAAGRSGLCHFATFLTHFTWLSVFGWMIAEGVTMYRQTVNALSSYGKKIEYYTLKCAICVHGGALVLPILGIILASSWEGFHYIRADYEDACFLDSPTTLLYLFLVPLYIVLCFSIYFFVRVAFVVVKSRRHSTSKSVDEGDFWKKQAKAVLSIATVTGVAWIIAPFLVMGKTGGGYAIAMQWIFNVFLGLQGVVTFIVLAVLSDDVRKCWREAYTGSSIAKFGEAFVSVGGMSTFQRKKRRQKHEVTATSRPIDQTKSTNFLSNYGQSRDNLIQNRTSFLDVCSAQDNHLSETDHHTEDQVFSPVEISPVQLSNDTWVKFVECAEVGVVTAHQEGGGRGRGGGGGGGGRGVDSQRKDIASDSGFHDSTSC